MPCPPHPLELQAAELSKRADAVRGLTRELELAVAHAEALRDAFPDAQDWSCIDEARHPALGAIPGTPSAPDMAEEARRLEVYGRELTRRRREVEQRLCTLRTALAAVSDAGPMRRGVRFDHRREMAAHRRHREAERRAVLRWLNARHVTAGAAERPAIEREITRIRTVAVETMLRDRTCLIPRLDG